MRPFERFVAVDWTGAAGVRHAAIAVAECGAGDDAPALVRPGHRWARAEVRDWVEARRAERVLVGVDAAFALPFADADAYFPGDADSPPDARALWAEVEAACRHEPDLLARGAVALRRRHYWMGAADGPRAPMARLREAERAWAALKAGAPSSCFVLLGAAQCGKASLSMMRWLAGTRLPVWPFDPLPEHGACLVEIYCAAFARMGGERGKLRERTALNRALGRLDSRPADVPEHFSDHIGDALVSAAGMRAAMRDTAFLRPAGMTAAAAGMEGWTLGIG